MQYLNDFAPVVSLSESQNEFFLPNITSFENINCGFPEEENLRVYLEDLEDAFLFRAMNNEEDNIKKVQFRMKYQEMSLTCLLKKEEMEKNKLKWEEGVDANIKSEEGIIGYLFIFLFILIFI